MTGPPRRLTRPSPPLRKAARRARAPYHTERDAVLAALRAEASLARLSAFAILNREFAGRIAAARARFQGAALDAALAQITGEHHASRRTLEAQLEAAARARRRTVLAGLRARRKQRAREFQAACVNRTRTPSAAESVSRERQKFRRRRARRLHHKP
jgi:hypothetical protein